MVSWLCFRNVSLTKGNFMSLWIVVFLTYHGASIAILRILFLYFMYMRVWCRVPYGAEILPDRSNSYWYSLNSSEINRGLLFYFLFFVIRYHRIFLKCYLQRQEFVCSQFFSRYHKILLFCGTWPSVFLTIDMTFFPHTHYFSETLPDKFHS